MKNALIMALAGLTVSISTVTQANDKLIGDPVAGKAKSGTCVACHGADGNSINPEWPKLAGQSESYLFKQLMDFKAQKGKEAARQNASMTPMVAGLSDQDMADLAAYYASQTISPGAANQELVDLGRQVYKGGNNKSGVAACASCHGPNGIGNPAAKFPALAGQHATYTEAQLMAFSKDVRSNDPAQMMRDIAARLSDDEMTAVSEYIAGLQN